MKPVIEITDISKQYQLGEHARMYGNFREELTPIALRKVDCVEDGACLTVIKSDFCGTGVVPAGGLFMLNNRWTLGYDNEEVAR